MYVYSYKNMSEEERLRRRESRCKYDASEKGKEMRAKSNKRYAEAHREELNAYAREYYRKNRDKIREQRRKNK